MVAVSSFGQTTTVTVGTGTGTTSNLPIVSCYGYTYSQQIYYASELLAAGVGAGQISKLRFKLSSGASTNSNGWTVYMGNSVKTQFTSTTDWEVIGNLSQVFSGTVTFPTAGNWMEIVFTTPFNWDGVSNIVIGIDENVPSYYCSDYWNYTTSTVNRGIYYRNDTTNPDPAAPPTATGRVTGFPNIQIDISPSVACSGTPAHANTLTSAANVCTNGTANLSLNTNYFVTGMTYQWQQNDGSGWADIAGANANTYTTPALTLSTDFRTIVTCTNSAGADTSAEVSVTVNPYPVVTVDHTDVATCSGEPANVTASGADTYSWSPATMVTPSTTSATVNIMPATTATYTVTGTTTAGCSSTATVHITPVTLVKPTVTYDPSENCTPGSPVTIEVIGLPAEITSGGTWEYRWLAPDGVTVLQDWNSSSSYTFIPTADSVYGHFYQVRSTSCSSIDYVDSMYTTIAIGFGADVTLTNYNCNTMGGTIALTNPFGQVAITELYNNPLSDALNLPNITLSGNASITSGRAQLTPSATGQSGYMQLAIPSFQAGLNNSMTVSFNMTADTPINTYGTGGADGIAYSFGDDAASTANGTGHNGKGTKLRLSFDAAGNSSENGNVAGIYLVYGWTATNAFGPASTQTLAYSSNTSLWKIQADVPVVLSITSEGKATVTVGGQVVFSDIQLPAAYMAADVSTWKHLFSAATGGDAMRQAVSNLDIEAGNLNYGITAGNSSTAPSDWQAGTSFTDLLPGTYDIWIAKDTNGTCLKNIGTYEILNTNPIVELGNDTTICEGQTLILDAGNPGSVYTWSGSNTYTQTMEVADAGSYIVYVTDPQGCLGIGTINVDVNAAPSATGIYSQGEFPTVFFAVTSPENADAYAWNFGDGATINNGPSSVSHTYANDGTFTVTATLTNDCGTQTYTTSVTIHDYTSVAENVIDGLAVYPNPASQQVTISLPNSETSEISVYSLSGALIQAGQAFYTATTLDVSQWQKGIYFLHISNQGKSSVSKLVVQ